MARYPGADWRPLPENATQSRIVPWGVVLHTAVSNSKDIKGVWDHSTVESHFYVAEDGNVIQYMDTEREADCQRDGNNFGGRGHISIETWDGAGKVWDGRDVRKLPRWNDAQVEALVKLLVWLGKTHGVPMVKIPAWNGRGIGYHAQFTGKSYPRWNASHACPGPARIAQVEEIIAAAAKAAASPIGGGPAPAPKPKPKPAPVPQKPAVSLSAVVKAAKTDPSRRQGGTTPHAADDVKHVEAALKREGLLSQRYAGDGSYGTRTRDAYAGWQRRCGYRGPDADGIPGKSSLTRLGAKYGFRVVA